jgi:hypothetical protein
VEECHRLTADALLPLTNARGDELHAARQALTVVELQTNVEWFFGHDFGRNSERQRGPFVLPGGATLDALRRQLTWL